MITVTLPDGRRIDVQSDDAGKAAQIAHKWSQANPPQPKGKAEGSGWGAQFLEGVLPGTSEALGGVFEAINDHTPDWLKYGKGKNLPNPPRSLTESYNAGHKNQRSDNKAWADANPRGATASQLGGFGAGFILPTNKVATGASLLQKAKATAKAAGIYSAASGGLSSEADSIAGKGEDAFSSGVLGSLTGFAAPFVLRGAGAMTAPLRPLVRPLVRKSGEAMQALSKIAPPWLGKGFLAAEGAQLSRDPVAATANRELDQTIRSSTNPGTGAPMRPRDVPEEVRRRQSMGVPAVAADLDEPLRGRFAKATHTPGPALTAVRRAIASRQASAAQRAEQHLAGALGPIGDVRGQAEVLNEAASTAAAPLYAKSDAHPIPAIAELRELFSRPTGRKAIENAARSLQDQGGSPFTEGLIQASDGTWSTGPVPRMSVYDHAKTHLDDAVFGGQSPFATPELRRDGEGARSIRRRLLQIMDGGEINAPETLGTPGVPAVPTEGLNPHWKAARDAYAGPVQSRKALELGEEMAGAGAGDISSRLGSMTDGQQEFFRLGHRSGLADDLKSLPEYADASKRLTGTAEKREAIAAAHGPEAADALLQRMGPEQDASRTWEAVRGGAGARASDAAQQDQHLADAGRGILQTLAGHPGPGILNIVSAVAKGQRGGDAIEGRIASVLSEQDPQKLTGAIRDVLRERARKALVERNANKATQGAGRFMGSLIGTNLTAPLSEQPDY